MVYSLGLRSFNEGCDFSIFYYCIIEIYVQGLLKYIFFKFNIVPVVFIIIFYYYYIIFILYLLMCCILKNYQKRECSTIKLNFFLKETN